MPHVRVEPAGIDLEVEAGETIMACAERNGYYWPTICHGDAECAICWIEVLEGADCLEPPGGREGEALELVPGRRFLTGVIRLACQAGVLGDVVVRKRGVRPVDESVAADLR